MDKLKKHILIFSIGLSLCLSVICGCGVLLNLEGNYYTRNEFNYKDSIFGRRIAYNYAEETCDYLEGWTDSYNVKSRLENNSTNAAITVYDADGKRIYSNNQKIKSDSRDYEFYLSRYKKEYEVHVFVPDEITIRDDFYFTSTICSFFYQNRNLMIWGLIVFLVLSLVQLAVLIKKGIGAGEEGNKNYSRLNLLPMDLSSAAIITADGILLAFFATVLSEIPFQSGKFHVLLSLIFFWAGYIMNIWYLYSFFVQIKERILFKNLLIVRILHFLIEKFRILWTQYTSKTIEAIPLVWRVIVSTAVLFFFNLFCLFILASAYGFLTFLFLLIWVVGDLSVLVFLCKQTLDWCKLKETAKQLAHGDLNQKMDTSKMLIDIKQFGDDLNQIKVGLNEEVEKRMKSERFKTELVTNVSHDLKTPLTSIINYIDLLKNEESEEKRKEYIDILEHHSLRLKKLTEDLIEASKASTGNVKVDLMVTNLSEMISQVTAEFQDRFDKNNLTLVVDEQSQNLHILADGRLLYRIFDNILLNACKYSMEGTRVYLDVAEKEQTVEIEVKNISREKLNVKAEDLMERFVRGDSSRNTEGSGLGLSIAKSLSELIHGTMNLVIDGDLFKVVLEFNKAESKDSD